MSIVDNDENQARADRIRAGIIDWIFLPVPLVLVVLGIGILSGLFFRENFLLRGSAKLIFGAALVVYGAVRSGMIIRRLVGRKKGVTWIKKS